MSVMTRDSTEPTPRSTQRLLESITWPFSMRRLTSLTLALMLVTVGTAVCGFYGALQQSPRHSQVMAWSACAMLVGLTIAMLLLGKYMLQKSLLYIERQVRSLRCEDPDETSIRVPDDLRPVMSALKEHLTLERSRVNRLNLQKKELDVQKRVAEAERSSTEAIIRSISDAVLVIDPFGELMLANTAAEELFEFRLEVSRHRPIERVLADASLVTLIKDARTSSGRSESRQVEYSAVRNGHTETFNITLSTVVDPSGEVRGLVAVFHDITRDRELAQVKTDFVSDVSHELRTPLSSIKAYVEMLVDGEARDDETRGRFYRIIEGETDRLQRLISNILNISRIEAGVVEVHGEVIDANSIVSGVLETLQPQAVEKTIRLTTRLADDLPHVLGDRDLLHQAALNVVSNAIKYTPAGGEVRVETDADRATGDLCITVTDTGIGIGARDLYRVFDKFYRSSESAEMGKGTGLGLNLVKQIVEKVHQGEISITSELGSGTTVVLRLPLLMD